MRKGLKAARTEDRLHVSSSIKTTDAAPHHASMKRQAEDPATAKQQRDRIKNTCTVSARMRQVVEQMLACDAEQYALAMQQTTIFAFKSHQSELVLSFLQEMRRENCNLYQNKDALLQIISDAYDRTQALLTV